MQAGEKRQWRHESAVGQASHTNNRLIASEKKKLREMMVENILFKNIQSFIVNFT